MPANGAILLRASYLTNGQLRKSITSASERKISRPI
jgi:hypothetical protein